ncbi:MAG: cupin domain-containing protein [Burkholderiales bacterium]|nr:cupin domain-containing protein [Burkholderiales bacterium]
MKIDTRKSTGKSKTGRLLGGLTAAEFLRDYWQRKPLLVRGAMAGFIEPLDKREVLDLTMRDDAESRLIFRAGNKWSLVQGPLSRRDLAAARAGLWTVLVQDTQHFSQRAHELLARFNFIPHARIDDLMVSYAVPGAGVGPHVDSYDVFLVQGHGSRRWRVSAQKDLQLRDDVPLKILARFKAEDEFVLEHGDMLYLPPGYAHDGVAQTECLTWSVGLRAPSSQDLGMALLDYLRDEIQLSGQYQDAGLAPTRSPGKIGRDMQTRFRHMLGGLAIAVTDPQNIHACLGRYLTEPKSHVFFDGPDAACSPAAFRKNAMRAGLVLNPKSRMLYDSENFYINGEAWPIEADSVGLLRRLADTRFLSAATLASCESARAFSILHEAHASGYIMTRQANDFQQEGPA